MSYTRLDPAELNAWATLNNDQSWSWNQFLQYYYKSEHYQVPTAQMLSDGVTYCTSCHGYSGPVKTGYTNGLATDNLHNLYNSTTTNLGIPPNQDVNSAKMRGFTIYPRTVDTALNVREDAARAYYWPYTNRTNLVLIPNTTVTNIVWAQGTSGGNITASGVQATNNAGVTTIYQANHEVILAAGTLKTPQVLELSGVGNPTILNKYNIPVKVSLPGVGENLQDQINNAAGFSSNAQTSYTGERGWALYANATDIFGSSTSSEASTVKSALSSYASQAAAQSNGAVTSSELLAEFTTQYNLLFQTQVPMAEIVFYTSGTKLEAQYWGLLPFARGNVHINSASPSAAPTINPNYWMTNWDRDAQIGIAKFIRRFFATAPLSSIVTGETSPGLSKVPSNADTTTWSNYLKSVYRPNYHPVGSAAMKPRSKGGVVSPRLLVFGTTNVRVVDASCWPTQVSGHLSSTVYAVAEKAAVMIQQDDGTA